MSKYTWISIVRDRIIQTKNTLQTKIAINRLTQQFVLALQPSWQFLLGAWLMLGGLKKMIDDRVTRRTHQAIHPIYELTLVKQLAPYSGLLVVAIFVLIGNQADQRAYAALTVLPTQIVDLKPEDLEQVLVALDPLTPEFEEEPEFVASLLLQDEMSFVSRPGLDEIVQAETLSKKDPLPYIVQKGDTMVSIAKNNDRTVATILEANHIQPENAGKLTPGTTLLIPQEDTSTSLAWLEIENKAKAEAARQAADRRARASNNSRALAAGRTSREQSSQGFSGERTADFSVPIQHNGITRGLSRGHAGIDYRADTGTPVAAAANGRVIETTRGWAGGFGNSVLIDHGQGVTTRYAHLSSVSVSAGTVVSQGDLVGYSGNTGNSTGPHLHFETRVGGRAVNPF